MDRTESAKELLKRELPFLSVRVVQNREGCVVHDSVARVIYEDKGRFPSAVPVLAYVLSKLSKQGKETIEVGVFIQDYVHRLCTQAYHSFCHVNSVLVD